VRGLACIVVAIHERLCQKDLRLRIGWLALYQLSP